MSHGYCPEIVFNAHTGPAAQMWSLDDFVSADFDSVAHGFVGGATPNIENQRLPIQISREALPPDVPRWGQPYKDHLRQWQHIAAVRIQPDALSYQANYLDLDPRHRDRSGLGLPVIRVTYDMQPNEHRMLAFMEDKAEEILRAMGATKTWRGPALRRRGQQPRPRRLPDGRRSRARRSSAPISRSTTRPGCTSSARRCSRPATASTRR